MKDDFDKFMENNIDINQYIQYDEKVCDMIIYFNKNKFLADALEYLQNDNADYQIIVEEWKWLSGKSYWQSYKPLPFG